MQCFLDFSSRFNGTFDVLADSLWDFELVLLGDFDECVELAQVDSRFNRVLHCADPPLQLLLLRRTQSLQVAADASLHLGLSECQGCVGAEAVVGEVVGEDEEELGLGVVVAVAVQKLHGLRSRAVPRDDAYISQGRKKKCPEASCQVSTLCEVVRHLLLVVALHEAEVLLELFLLDATVEVERGTAG